MEAEKKVQLRILMNHLKKEATGNFDDASIHHNEKADVEIPGDPEKSIQLRILTIEDDFKDRMKQEVIDPEYVDDIEKAGWRFVGMLRR